MSLEQTPRMGGKSNIRVSVMGRGDALDALISEQRLSRLLRDAYQDQFSVEVHAEHYARCDVFQQQLGMESPPSALPAVWPDDPYLELQFSTDLLRSDPDVVVFSVSPEVQNSVWVAKEGGFLLYPFPDWTNLWSEEQAGWFAENFDDGGLLELDAYALTFRSVIEGIKKRLDAHIIVFNCSSIAPGDVVHNYQGIPEPLPLRIDRFNLVLTQLSRSEGVSIINADRLLAAIGAEGKVLAPCRYSDAASEELAREFLRVIDDVGFFEARPLVPQIGRPVD